MAVFYNSATLSYNDNVTNSNIVTGELLEVLSATKTSLSDDYEPGDRITYLVSLVNTGTTAFTNLTITDDLGGYDFNGTTVRPLTYIATSARYYVNGVQQATPTATTEPELTFTGLNVPAGGNAILLYEARPNAFASPADGGTIDNTVTITGAGLTEPLTAAATVTASDEPRLTISKSLSPDTVQDNGEITYTFVIQNTGSQPAEVTDNVVVTDTFNPILNPIAVTYNETPWTETTNYTYDETTGLFQTVAGQITVPAATYTQDATTGQWITTPGVSILRVTGTV